jgi:hypothetical protein
MNRRITIALLGTAFAVAAGLIGINTISATPLLLAQSVPTQETGAILGHVTYQVTDSTGHIKKYVQTDNLVVDIGKKCAITKIFQYNNTQVCTLPAATNARNGFNWISIGNGTGSAANADIQMVNGGANVKNQTVQVTPTLSQSTGNPGIATLSRTFSFNANNATTITVSALMDGIGNGAGARMFAEKTGLGVTVSSGDSLTISWTVNVG